MFTNERSVMTNVRAIARPTIVDGFLPASWVSSAALVLGGTAVLALMSFDIEIQPIPISGQTLGVLLIGSALGWKRATTSIALYLAIGLMGLPVFAGYTTAGLATIMKPSFGFALGFLPAAALIGWLSEHRVDRKFKTALPAFALASIIPFLIGVPYMANLLPMYGLPNDFVSVMQFGVLPFIVPGLIKCAIAAALLPLAWRFRESLNK